MNGKGKGRLSYVRFPATNTFLHDGLRGDEAAIVLPCDYPRVYSKAETSCTSTGLAVGHAIPLYLQERDDRRVHS